MNEYQPAKAESCKFFDDFRLQLRLKLAGQTEDIELTESEDELVLHGHCASFYAKQLSQEILRQLTNDKKKISNQLVVRNHTTQYAQCDPSPQHSKVN